MCVHTHICASGYSKTLKLNLRVNICKYASIHNVQKSDMGVYACMNTLLSVLPVTDVNICVYINVNTNTYMSVYTSCINVYNSVL